MSNTTSGNLQRLFCLKLYYMENQHRLPIQHTSNELILDSYTKYNINQFLVAFMYKPVNKNHKAPKYQVVKSTGTCVTGDTLTPIRHKLFRGNTYVFCLPMFCGNKKTTMYKVIGTVLFTEFWSNISVQTIYVSFKKGYLSSVKQIQKNIWQYIWNWYSGYIGEYCITS